MQDEHTFLAIARAAIRDKENRTPAQLRVACNTLLTYGDAIDVKTAALLLAQLKRDGGAE